MAARPGGDPPEGLEPVRPAIQRAGGIEIAHIGGKPGNLAQGNIGRIGEDQPEAPTTDVPRMLSCDRW